MDLTKLKQINEAKVEQAQSIQRHNEVLNASIHTQNSVLSAIELLIKYLEGHTTKTEVVNQLTHVGTPDALKVVQSVNELHNTLKTHKNTDLTEITKVMSSILEETKKIPKELPKLEQQEQQDYSKQFSELTKAIQAVEKVCKEQELVVHPPTVNVPETNVHIDAPDLKPLQTAIKDVVTAIKKIVIPEYKTDNKVVEKLLKDSNKLLKGLLEKPVSSGGGGGSGSSWVAVNIAGIPIPIELTADGKVPVEATLASSPEYVKLAGSDANQRDSTYYGDGLTAGIAAVHQRYFDGSVYNRTPAKKTLVDKSTTTDVIYVGVSPIGTSTSAASWQITKIDKTVTDNVTITYGAAGAFTNKWTERATVVTYS